jgi:hypothetical protein
MTKEKLIKKLGKETFDALTNSYNMFNAEYEKFLTFLCNFEPILKSKGVGIDEVCQHFTLPINIPEIDNEVDEDDEELEDSLTIPGPSGPLLEQVKNKFWVKPDVEKKLSNSFYYKLVTKNLNLEPSVQQNVSQNAIHILGRVTNPLNWDKDRQGLVMGMVQSGKTMSMLNVMALGMSSGYNLFILLAGTTESLRQQSQDRINQAFELEHSKFENVKEKVTIISPTYSVGYSKIPFSGANIFLPHNPKRDYNPIIIITVLKQIDNLIKLNEDIEAVHTFCQRHNIDFNERYKAIVLDDESDNASLDISDGQAEGIYEQLVKLRGLIKKNCYIGYTATPQGCLAADQDKVIGYPRDFLWLLEPMKIPGTQVNLSYLGLHEFFLRFSDSITKVLSPNAWPHYRKNLKGKVEGVFNPLTNQITKDEKLAILESDFADYLIRTKKYPKEFIDAMINFIIGGGIRWYRYHEKKEPGSPVPDKDKVIVDYPYHAMMFNLSLTKKNQKKTRIFLNECWKIVRNKFNKWLVGKEPSFDLIWEEQLKKTKSFKTNEDLSNINQLKQFMLLVVNETSRQIPEQGAEFIYMLNSEKEADSLNYEDQDPYKRTKKCAIFLGGNILSRGLTINNLSVSVFVRTQVSSLGDTNLQMCRWFGHKFIDVDIISLYLMNDTRRLFKDITRCDDGLRASIKQSIIDNKSPLEVLIELWGSNLFNVTSNLKAKLLGKQAFSAVSYTGKVKDLRDPFCNGDIDKIEIVIDKFEKFISNVKCKTQKKHLNRGILFEDVDLDQVRNFLKSINEIPKDALYVSPVNYAEYLDTWEDCYEERTLDYDIPKINIGFMGLGKLSERQRDYAISPTNEVEAKTDIPSKIGSLLGGVRTGKKKYKGDRFFDKDQKWHDENIDKKKIGERGLTEPILILFYYLDPNYLFRFGKGKRARLKPKDTGYLSTKKVLTMSIVTPFGGPQYKVFTNETIKI